MGIEREIADAMIEAVELNLEKHNVKLESFTVTVKGKKVWTWTVTFNQQFKLESYYDTWEFYMMKGDKDLVTELIKKGLEELKNERS